MLRQHCPRRLRAVVHRLPPLVASARCRELEVHDVEHGVEQVALVLHVVVERHRLDAQLGGELAHAQGFQPADVGERDGDVHGPVSRHRLS
jgi:hypothetical protein